MVPKLKAGFTPWKFWIVMPKKDGGIVGGAEGTWEVDVAYSGRFRSTLAVVFSEAAWVTVLCTRANARAATKTAAAEAAALETEARTANRGTAPRIIIAVVKRGDGSGGPGGR